jgi:putative hemolysin
MSFLNWLNDHDDDSATEPPLLKARLAELEEIPVTKLMIPRPLIAGLDYDIQLRRLRRSLAGKPPYMPVYKGDLDRILGWVEKAKVIELLNSPGEQSLDPIIQPIGQVPETMTAAELADRFLKTHSPLLVVTNSNAQTLGIVLLAEFLKSIFGFDLNPVIPPMSAEISQFQAKSFEA